jgi:multifunctional beta-oxidation protein
LTNFLQAFQLQGKQTTVDMSLDFKDKVVVITGAGRGIGRAYAHAFAARGAKIVVNDLGSGVFGEAKGERVADVVVKELNDKYGDVAVADYHGVDTDGDKIIQTAVDKFQKVDIVINNAYLKINAQYLTQTVEFCETRVSQK